MSLVLVVDDDPLSIQLFDLILKRSGFDVIAARTAMLGLKLFYQSFPDLVIVDDMMPDMSGGEMCKHLKSDPAARHIPVILVSAGLRVQDERYVREVGADTVLVKPTLSKDVLKAVAFCLNDGVP